MANKVIPKISVIMPVYNVEQYIEQSLRSVLFQSLYEIEVICVDDGSTDSTSERIEKIQRDDSRVRLMHQNNSGAGKARNKGLAISKGDFIAFLDGDDYYPNRCTLENLYYNAKLADVAISGGCMQMLLNDKIVSTFSGKNQKYVFDYQGIMKYKDYQFDYGYHRFIYSRDLLQKNNIQFPDYRRFQDPPFFVKAMICADCFYALDIPTYVYRSDGKIRSCNKEKVLGILAGLQDNLRMAADNNLGDLYELTLQRLTIDCRTRIEDSLRRGEIETYNELVRICNAIGYEGIDCSNYLGLLREMMDCKK